MRSWENSKTQGNEAFRAGKYQDAIEAYTNAVVSISGYPSLTDSQVASSSNRIVSIQLDPSLIDVYVTLLSNRSAAFLKVGSYQFARHDAKQALKLAPSNEKAQFRLASALFHLGSYSKALDVLRTMQSKSDEEILNLMRQVLVCVVENQTGDYDIAKIEAEEPKYSRLSHANYCSRAIELRASEIGGVGGRGIFSNAIIPQGTLLVASKAIACGFQDELGSPELKRALQIVKHCGQTPSKVALVNQIFTYLGEGRGRAILNLEGGGRQELDVDLHRDDVYDEIASVPTVSLDRLEDLVRRNSFGIEKPVRNGSSQGIAVYHVPSFFNHSCMPNTFHYHIGDMIFIVSSTIIPAGNELFWELTSSAI